MKQVLLFIFFGIIGCSTPKNREYIVKTSCGQCQFNLKTKKGCDLAIKINNKAYFVTGAHIDDYGDAHDKNKGFCNVIRKAKAVGQLENNTFKLSKFTPLLQK